MSDKRFYHVHIWECELGIVGTQLSMSQANQMIRDYPQQFRAWILSGRTAVVRIITEDENISRVQAIAYSKALVEDRMATITFDLDRCEVTWNRIFPETPNH